MLLRNGAVAVGVVFAVMVCFGSARANASGILYQFDNVFSGSVAPSPTPPWMNAAFQNAANGVLLTIASSGLTNGEFVSGLYFNLNPADTVDNLNFSLQDTAGSFSAPTISTGENAFKADGDGYYDILLNFSTIDGYRFVVGDSITYLITGVTGLTASDFGYLSYPAVGDTPNGLFAAAHIQGIGTSSAWINPSQLNILSVPEPAPVAFAGMGVAIALLAMLGLQLQLGKKQAIARVG